MADDTPAVPAAHPASQPAPSSALPVAPAPAVVAHPGGKDWTSALVIAGGPGPDAGEHRPVIVAEGRGDDGKLVSGPYPGGADLYLRSGPDGASFPDGSTVKTLGADLEQGLMWGFSGIQGVVHVGPAHPAYAAANLAYLHGAKEIEVRGLSDFWKDRLRPWFDKIATDTVAPAAVKVTLT